MRKSILIAIAIVYVASIVVVSVFGLKATMYQSNIQVTGIECVNQDKGEIFIGETNGIKTITMNFTEPGDLESLTGTILQLEIRVLPDDATNKEIGFRYARENYPQVHFHQIEGRETGAIAFTGIATFTLTIYSLDVPSIYTQVLIDVV
ncbi:MAG: hypothetical protein E7356_01240 [Clostridiales bacterium]|nr:hypothetical protein [Clostridiales bacterium]